MQRIDRVRGYEREILFAPEGGYSAGGALPVVEFVVEVKDNDFELRCPSLSFRFFHQPMPRSLAEASAAAGHPLYDEESPIGVEVVLGPELVSSLVSQLKDRLPEYDRVIQNEPNEER